MTVHTVQPAHLLEYRLVVYGTPGPQGSKRHVGGGRMIESSAKVKPWREAVKHLALYARKRKFGELNPGAVLADTDGGMPPIDGPIACRMVFTLTKPASRPKGRRTWPCTKPDLSKLLRSTEDALTDAGIWKDDALVVEYLRTAKVFPGEDPESLDSPGAIIEVYRLLAGAP